MASAMLNSGTHRTTFFVLIILLLSSVPMMPIVSADEGIPAELQAQGIIAVFDEVSETTTVTWRNIDQSGGDPDLFEELWDATYHVYRSSSPITSENVLSLSSWHSVVACEKNIIEPDPEEPWNTNPNKCRSDGNSGNHPEHSATFQVGAGTNGSFFYAITTELGNGNITTTLSVDASIVPAPVEEVTTPIRSPYNIIAAFDAATSQTNIQWINYNSINPVLPEDGVDAFEIHIWRTDELIDRSNGQVLLSETPIATLSPTNTTYSEVVPPMTNRDSFYSVTYLLPNWTPEGEAYEDTRFLSNNAMTSAVLEDNTPPADVDTTEALFIPNEDGTGITSIIWDNILSEDGEQYRIYRHGEYFNTTNNPYVQLIGTVQGNAESIFNYNIPFNTYGDFVYCVVIVDQFGTSNPVIPMSACDIVD